MAVELARELTRRSSSAPRTAAPLTARDRLIAAAVYYGGVVALVALVLVALNLDLLLGPGTARGVLRLVLGGLLLSEGAALTFDLGRSRELLAVRLRQRGRRRVVRAAGLALQLGGVVLLSAGVFDVLRGALDL
jgi:hypothetical protein